MQITQWIDRLDLRVEVGNNLDSGSWFKKCKGELKMLSAPGKISY